MITDNGPLTSATCTGSPASASASGTSAARPYRPRTNGKAKRFIQTLTRRWAHGRSYNSSAERTSTLNNWLDHYNYKRPHGSLSHKPPGSRLTNAPGNDT